MFRRKHKYLREGNMRDQQLDIFLKMTLKRISAWQYFFRSQEP